jgi:ATP synthase protein I
MQIGQFGYLCEKFHKGYISAARMAEKRDENQTSRGFGVGYGIVAAGFQLAFVILFFMWMGALADGRLGTRPLFLIVGLVIGLAAGIYTFLLKVQAAAAGQGRQPRGDKRRQ